ncbi:MAG: hypothetical protein NTU57_02560 [Candidatus Aenigmarchaeota archaeon]|nr:hypothetical protein [Candidatus Aenigmarchaeota archaeon]
MTETPKAKILKIWNKTYCPKCEGKFSVDWSCSDWDAHHDKLAGIAISEILSAARKVVEDERASHSKACNKHCDLPFWDILEKLEALKEPVKK